MNSEDKKSLGRQLRQARDKKGYTGDEFAKFLGISRQQLSSYENGHVASPFEVLLRAAEELDTEFVVAGYKLTKGRLGPPRGPSILAAKQLTFTFHEGRKSRRAMLHVTTLKGKVVIRASVNSSRS